MKPCAVKAGVFYYGFRFTSRVWISGWKKNTIAL
jgi:hypothetical protein